MYVKASAADKMVRFFNNRDKLKSVPIHNRITFIDVYGLNVDSQLFINCDSNNISVSLHIDPYSNEKFHISVYGITDIKISDDYLKIYGDTFFKIPIRYDYNYLKPKH